MNEWFRVVSEPVDAMPFDLSLLDVECFLPVAIICGFCVLVWIMAVQKYLSRDGHARQGQSARRCRLGQNAGGKRISAGMSKSLMSDTAPMGAGTSATVHASLINCKLDALTNLRLVRDATSSTGWKLDIGPFPGWKDAPTWFTPAPEVRAGVAAP